MFVGVKVNVGTAVSEGWGGKVSVDVNIDWMVAVPVGEGSGLIVQVGSMVGVSTGWRKVVNIPQAIDKNVVAKRRNVRYGNLMNGEMYTNNGDCFGLTPSQ